MGKVLSHDYCQEYRTHAYYSNNSSNELGVQAFLSRSSSLNNNQTQEIEQTTTNVMETKVKLFYVIIYLDGSGSGIPPAG